MKNLVILISGRGSNMQAIVDAQLSNAHIAAVIANRPEATGLTWAAEQRIPTVVLDHTAYPNRETFDTHLAHTIDQFSPDLVILAGFMRILTPSFTQHYEARLINIHPSLLPAFPGLRTHERALATGCKVAGCTVHFVTPDLDHGPIIAQGVVPIVATDTPSTLAARVLAVEHRIYPMAIQWFIDNRLKIIEGKVHLDQPYATTHREDGHSFIVPLPDRCKTE